MTTQTREKQVSAQDYKSSQKSTWCPACGNFGILNSLQTALANLNIAPHEVMIVSGIGCGSKLPDYIHANGLMTLHGRGGSVASGAHLANTDLLTITVSGDGDSYGIGIGHLIHNARRNLNMVHIVENNEIYGLTKGQYSPVSKAGLKTSTSPEGAVDFPLNPGLLALSVGATFIAYANALDPKLTTNIIEQAIKHRGYSLVNIMQTCPSYQKAQNPEYFKQSVFEIQKEIPDYNPRDRKQAFELLDGSHEVWSKPEIQNKIYPMGIIYQENRPIYSDLMPVLKDNKKPLVEHSLELDKNLFEELKKSYT